jgi:hypothetical protein
MRDKIKVGVREVVRENKSVDYKENSARVLFSFE